MDTIVQSLPISLPAFEGPLTFLPQAGHKPPATFLERFFSQATANPTRTALRDPDVKFTYAELDLKVASLCDWFRLNGVGPGMLVCVHLRRRADAVATILAILSIGAAYVPLDCKAPSDRLAFFLQDSRCMLIISDEPEIARGAAEGTRVVTLDQIAAQEPGPTQTLTAKVNSTKTGQTRPIPAPESLAYLIYTSGSTGVPKGVQITHSNLAHLLEAWDSVMTDDTGESDGQGAVGGSTVSLLLSSLSFDASVAELFWPLSAGATLIVAPDSVGFDPDTSLTKLREDYGVNHIQCTPTRATLWLSDKDSRDGFDGLAHMVIGGEALPVALAADLLTAGVRRLTNAYGPTEATVWTLANDVSSSDLTPDQSVVAIGKPIAGVQATVVGPEFNELGIGEVGELIVAGPLVSPGYLGRPQLNEEKFRSFEFPGGQVRCYRTGDLASRRADGKFDFFGRTDHQVKIRGYRIELGEVEAKLGALAEIRQAAVVVEPTRKTELVAFVVLEATETADKPTGEELRLAAAERLGNVLTEVMIPSKFVILNELPQTTSSKVDRQTLTNGLVEGAYATGLRSRSAEGKLEPFPESPLDAMSGDFSAIFDREVGPDQSFFVVGGHSINALELLERVRVRTGVGVAFRSLIENPTPRLFALAVASSIDEGQDTREPILVDFEWQRKTTDKTANKTTLGLTDRPNLYLIHGAAGNVLRFSALADKLRDRRHTYGIQAFGIDGLSAPDQTLAEVLDRYEEEVARHCAGRRIDLGGYSSGGLIAIQLAERLIARNIEVNSLILLDPVDETVLATSLFRRTQTFFANFRARKPMTPFEFAKNAVIGWRLRSEWDEAGTNAALALGYTDLFDHYVEMLGKSTISGPVDCPALLLKSSYEDPFRERHYNWAQTLPSKVEVAWIHSKHDRFVTGENVIEIANAIDDFLRRIDA